MSCCPSSQDKEVYPRLKSIYNNKPIAILFPVTFFCGVTGITFLCWPEFGLDTLEDNSQCDGITPCNHSSISAIAIVGILLIVVAGICGLFTIVMVCYIHLNNFDPKRLPIKIRVVERNRFTASTNYVIVTSESEDTTSTTAPSVSSSSQVFTSNKVLPYAPPTAAGSGDSAAENNQDHVIMTSQEVSFISHKKILLGRLPPITEQESADDTESSQL